MNVKDNSNGSIPDFNKMLWRCHCCNQERQDKFIKVATHDISSAYGLETGTMFINCKYCVDIPGCKEKAFDRQWVIKTFLPGLNKNANYSVEL